MRITFDIDQPLTFDCGKHVGFSVTPEQIATMAGHNSPILHAITIGLKNLLGDAHAGVVSDDFRTEAEWIEAKRKRAGEKFQSLLDGDVRTMRAGSPRVDGFTTWARRHVLSLLPKDKRKSLAETADKGVAYLDAVFAKNEAKLRPQIEAAIAEAETKAKAAQALASELDLDI